jgi:hypothetical protein
MAVRHGWGRQSTPATGRRLAGFPALRQTERCGDALRLVTAMRGSDDPMAKRDGCPQQLPAPTCGVAARAGQLPGTVARPTYGFLAVSRARDKSALFQHFYPIGAPGFEPGTSCSQSRRATRLRHAPSPLQVYEAGRKPAWPAPGIGPWSKTVASGLWPMSNR